jgi:hypothetical protein
MNEFYSIAGKDVLEENDFQLKDLGEKVVSMSIGGFGGSRGSDRKTYYRATTTVDYDRGFATKLSKTNPVYRCSDLIDHHLSYYVNRNRGDKGKFVQQMKYVVLPILEKRSGRETSIAFLKDWIEENEMTKKNKEGSVNVNVGNVNAPFQLQAGSPNSKQNQTVKYENDQVLELFQLLKSDIDKLDVDIREDFEIEISSAVRQLEKGKDVSIRLITIGLLIKDVGVGTLTNLIASPVYEVMKPYLGLQ